MWMNGSGSYLAGNPEVDATPGSNVAYNQSLVSAVIPVTAGMYFEMIVYQNSGGDLASAGAFSEDTIWFSMEIIE